MYFESTDYRYWATTLWALLYATPKIKAQHFTDYRPIMFDCMSILDMLPKRAHVDVHFSLEYIFHKYADITFINMNTFSSGGCYYPLAAYLFPDPLNGCQQRNINGYSVLTHVSLPG